MQATPTRCNTLQELNRLLTMDNHSTRKKRLPVPNRAALAAAPATPQRVGRPCTPDAPIKARPLVAWEDGSIQIQGVQNMPPGELSSSPEVQALLQLAEACTTCGKLANRADAINGVCMRCWR